MSALESEGVPKSISRVLDAAKIRADWRAKRKAECDGGETYGQEEGGVRKKRKLATSNGQGGEKGVKGSRILPGESLAHFNR